MAWSEKARAEAARAVDMLDHRKASSMDELTRMVADAALDAAAAVDGDAEWNAAISRAAHIVIAFGVNDYTAEEVAARIRTLKRG
jgi:hypothetical protein